MSNVYCLRLQALPLVAVFVGRKNESDQCKVLTLASGVGQPNYVEFPTPSDTTPLTPGKPHWANYVKGVVANYKGKFIFIKTDVAQKRTMSSKYCVICLRIVS